MAMTKRDFIALADTIKALENYYGAHYGDLTRGATVESVAKRYREALADFCQSQNPRFDYQLWLDYIAGKCGPSGGKRTP